jgi:hypothetical protein
MIDWRRTAELPTSLKIGRPVLLWNAARLMAEIGVWHGGGKWWVATTQTGGEQIDTSEYSHFALINPPDGG